MIKLTFQITQLPKITTNNTVEGYRPLDSGISFKLPIYPKSQQIQSSHWQSGDPSVP
jgi:hypothetical protein